MDLFHADFLACCRVLRVDTSRHVLACHRIARIEPRDQIPVEPDSVERMPQMQHYLRQCRKMSTIEPTRCGRNFGRNATEWLDRCVGRTAQLGPGVTKPATPASTTDCLVMPVCVLPMTTGTCWLQVGATILHHNLPPGKSFSVLGPDGRPAWESPGTVQTQDPNPARM
jgi:hypothetical protein